MSLSRDVRKEEICHSVNREFKFMEEFCNSEDDCMYITSREEKKTLFCKKGRKLSMWFFLFFCLFLFKLHIEIAHRYECECK